MSSAKELAGICVGSHVESFLLKIESLLPQDELQPRLVYQDDVLFSIHLSSLAFLIMSLLTGHFPIKKTTSAPRFFQPSQKASLGPKRAQTARWVSLQQLLPLPVL